MLLTQLSEIVPTIFPGMTERNIGKYASLNFPKLLPFLRMKVKSYHLKGFGYIMCMDTSMMGIMKLSTFAFTPSDGVSVPFLLVDTMSMGKKRLAYVEFYDCREEKEEIPALTSLRDKYAQVEDYKEKPAWYVTERMKGSLIKCASARNEEILAEMVVDALKAYATCIKSAGYDSENQKGLEEFSRRMIEEGNPSSGTLNLVLGKNKAEDFFRKVVMPMKNQSMSDY